MRRLPFALAAAPRVRRALLVTCLALAALPAGAARADTTIGQTFGSDVVDGKFCGAGVRAEPSYVVPPGGGTITSFSFHSNGNTVNRQLEFLVLRPTSTPGSYTVVGKTTLVTLLGTGLKTFPAAIPVRSGDILGIWTPLGIAHCFTDGTGVFFETGQNPEPTVGDTFAVDLITGIVLNLSANLVTGPTSKADCKNGGWKTFGDMFKNQGACVTLFDDDEQ